MARRTRSSIARKSDIFGFKKKGRARTEVKVLGKFIGPYKGSGKSAGKYSRAKKR